MLRRVLIVLCLLVSIAGAEMPAVGDYVAVTQSIGNAEQQTEGMILEINSTLGLMTLQSEGIHRRRTGGSDEDWSEYNFGGSQNITVGLATVANLVVLRSNLSV